MMQNIVFFLCCSSHQAQDLFACGRIRRNLWSASLCADSTTTTMNASIYIEREKTHHHHIVIRETCCSPVLAWPAQLRRLIRYARLAQYSIGWSHWYCVRCVCDNNKAWKKTYQRSVAPVRRQVGIISLCSLSSFEHIVCVTNNNSSLAQVLYSLGLGLWYFHRFESIYSVAHHLIVIDHRAIICGLASSNLFVASRIPRNMQNLDIYIYIYRTTWTNRWLKGFVVGHVIVVADIMFACSAAYNNACFGCSKMYTISTTTTTSTSDILFLLNFRGSRVTCL